MACEENGVSTEVVVAAPQKNREVAEIHTPPELQEMKFWAQHFVRSRLFKDATNESQAIVKIQAGREYGLQPHASMRALYIVPGSGTVSPTAALIASKIRSSKIYDYKILEHTDQICRIEFFYRYNRESLGIETFTAQDAKRAGTQNMGKFPKNMLFARCIMNGARFYCPDVLGGHTTLPYCVEEMTDNFDYDSDGSVVIKQQPVEVLSVNNNPTEREVFEKTVKEKFSLSLNEVATIFGISVSSFDGMTEEDSKRYVELLNKRQ